MSIKTEDVLINALNHEIRREILKLLSKSEASYTNLLEYFDISTGKLNYHLRLLEGLIIKTSTNFYGLSELGRKILDLLTNFQNSITDDDRPMIKQAYLSQQSSSPSFLHLMYVSRMKFKFWMLIIISIALVISDTIYLFLGGEILFALPVMVSGIIIAIGGIIWVKKIRKSAPLFINKLDRLLDKADQP